MCDSSNSTFYPLAEETVDPYTDSNSFAFSHRRIFKAIINFFKSLFFGKLK